MAKEIVQYTAKELPVALASEAQQPLMPEPVMKPQTTNVALKSVATSLSDVVEEAQRVQLHNEAVLGIKMQQEFGIEQDQKLIKEREQYQGDKALPTQDQPGFYQIVSDRVKQDIDDKVANSGLSPYGQDALRKTLAERARSILSQAETHELLQRHLVEQNNIDYDLHSAFNMIKSGAITTDDQFEKLVQRHNAMIDLMKPGMDGLKMLHRATLETQRIEFDKHNQVKAAYDTLYGQFKDEYGVVDTDKAVQAAMDPKNPVMSKLMPEQRNAVVHSLLTVQSNQDRQDDVKKSELVVDILDRKLSRDSLTNDKRWQTLRSPAKMAISNFLDAKDREERADARYEASEKRAERQEKQQNQQLKADQVYGDVMGKIAEGKYKNTTEILTEMTKASEADGGNKFILNKARGAIELFSKIESEPDLRDGIKRIDGAAKTGVFVQIDKNNPLGAANEIKTKFRTLYMTDPSFRGEKVNQWLNEQLKGKTKSAVGAWLNDVFTPKSAAEANAWSQKYGGAPLAPTQPTTTAATSTADTVSVGGTVYKVGDTYNGYKYIGGGKWEK